MATCPECDNEYSCLGNHWGMSDCSYPSLTQKQKEVITGILMGDGCICDTSKNPRLKVTNTSEKYLQYLDELFGCLSSGYHVSKTPEESAAIKKPHSETSNVENCSTIYEWSTRSLPELKEFSWYSSGKKVWPDDIDLTPTTLKHWFCGDGTWNNSGYRNYIAIAMKNERENTEKVTSYFENVNIPSPSNYATTNGVCIAQFTTKDSSTLWEYMGDPIDGFEYKWPSEYRN